MIPNNAKIGKIGKYYNNKWRFCMNQFDINDLTKGVYLVKAFDAQNRTKTMKLVKQ